MSTAAVAIFVALLSVGGTTLTAYLGIKARKPDQATADWSQFSAEMREWTEDRLRERDERIDVLETELGKVKTSFGVIKIKYRVALVHARYLHGQLAMHVDPMSIAQPPAEIVEDWLT